MLDVITRLKLFYPDIDHDSNMHLIHFQFGVSDQFREIIRNLPRELPNNFVLQEGQVNYHIQDNSPGFLKESDFTIPLLWKVYEYMKSHIVDYYINNSAEAPKTQNDIITKLENYFKNDKNIISIIEILYKTDYNRFKKIYDNCLIFHSTSKILSNPVSYKPNYYYENQIEYYNDIKKEACANKYKKFDKLFENGNFIGFSTIFKNSKTYMLLALDAILINYAYNVIYFEKYIDINFYELKILKRQNIEENNNRIRPIWQQKILLEHIGLFNEINKINERKNKRMDRLLSLITENAEKIANNYEIDPTNLNKYSFKQKSLSQKLPVNTTKKSFVQRVRDSVIPHSEPIRPMGPPPSNRFTRKVSKPQSPPASEVFNPMLQSKSIIRQQSIPEANKLINEYLYGFKKGGKKQKTIKNKKPLKTK